MKKRISVLILSLLVTSFFIKYAVGSNQDQNSGIDQVKEDIKGTWKSLKSSDSGIHDIWNFDGEYLRRGTTSNGDSYSENENLKLRYILGNSCASASPSEQASLNPNLIYLSFTDKTYCYEIRVTEKYLELLSINNGKTTAFERLP